MVTVYIVVLKVPILPSILKYYKNVYIEKQNTPNLDLDIYLDGIVLKVSYMPSLSLNLELQVPDQEYGMDRKLDSG
jgi:hypothetical protein